MKKFILGTMAALMLITPVIAGEACPAFLSLATTGVAPDAVKTCIDEQAIVDQAEGKVVAKGAVGDGTTLEIFSIGPDTDVVFLFGKDGCLDNTFKPIITNDAGVQLLMQSPPSKTIDDRKLGNV